MKTFDRDMKYHDILDRNIDLPCGKMNLLASPKCPSFKREQSRDCGMHHNSPSEDLTEPLEAGFWVMSQAVIAQAQGKRMM